MTRIIAGTAGGRRLSVPPGATTRPTADRAREGLFSSLQSLMDLDGAEVLDLYAGTGAIGLEAVSRGAARTTLVESDARALMSLRENIEALGLEATVVDGDVLRFLAGAPAPYRLVYVDPPYEVDVAPVLEALLPWVVEDGVVVVERRTRGGAPTVPAGMTQARSRRYGEATLWYFFRS